MSTLKAEAQNELCRADQPIKRRSARSLGKTTRLGIVRRAA